MSKPSIVLKCCLLLFAGSLAACDSSSTDIDPNRSVVPVSGTDQVAGTGALLETIRVRVVDDGQPVSGAEVRWRVIEGGGTVSQDVSTAGADGIATVEWTLGQQAGQNLLLATSGNGSVTITATSRFEIGTISVGYQHACAIATSGEAYCWGSNQQNQLGTLSDASSATPVRVNTGTRFASISAGWSHTCALTPLGEAYCWGDNTVGQLGAPLTTTRSGIPVSVATDAVFTGISAGFVHTCAVTTDGLASCWGSNQQGQFGPVMANQLKQISSGEFHACGIRNDTTAVCWGWNSAGQLGANLPLGTTTSTPQQTWQGGKFTQVAAGARHTCAIGADKRVYCWGRNGAGEIGQDPFINIAVPAVVVGTADYTAISAGNTHTCGISNERAFCWGSPLGNGTTSTSKTPVLVSNTLRFESISSGWDTTCGVADGEVWCWGPQSLSPSRIVFP